MQVKIFGSDAIESQQSPLGKAPEVLNAVDVTTSPIGIDLPVMINPVMLVAIKDQPIIGLPLICVDDTAPPDEFHDNRPYFCPSRVPDNLGVNPSITLEDAEYRNLSRTPSPPAPVSTAKVAFIQFNLALKSLTDGFLIRSDFFSEKAVISVGCVAIYVGYSGCLSGG